MDIPDEAWHGTLNGYTNRGCRCSGCRDANREYNAGARKRRFAAAKDPNDARHGTSNFYGNHGCRCTACRASWAADLGEDARRRRAAS